MSSLNLPEEVFSSDELKDIYNRYYGWSSSSSAQSFVHEVLCDAAEEYGMNNASKDLKDWFGKLCKGERSSDELFGEFKTLVTTSPFAFRRLCSRLRVCYTVRKPMSLCSSDNVVFEMKKSAATSQSNVFRNIIDCFPDDQEHEIPVQVSSLVLSNTISFCNKKHKFNNIIETAVEQLKGALNRLKGTVNDYMGWINAFVKSNKPLFSHLHQAADYLHIPALLELTSMAIGDMRESSAEEISEWYAGLSIPRMLSPLGIQAFSTLSHPWELYTRAPDELQSPLQRSKLTPLQYSLWLDSQWEDQIWKGIKATLDDYAANVRGRGDKEFSPVYPLMLQLGSSLSEKAQTSSKS